MPSAISFQIEEFGDGISHVFNVILLYGFFNISLLSIKKARPHTVEPTKIGKCLIYLFFMVGPTTKF